MAQVLTDLVDAAELHYVPPTVLLSTCLIESGLNSCGRFCGVRPSYQEWACAHGANCEVDSALPPRRIELQTQLRVSAFLLSRQYQRARNGSWTYAVQGFHLGDNPQRLAACPPWHRHGDSHHGVYSFIVMGIARRVTDAMGVQEPYSVAEESEEVLWADSQRRTRIARR